MDFYDKKTLPSEDRILTGTELHQDGEEKQTGLAGWCVALSLFALRNDEETVAAMLAPLS